MSSPLRILHLEDDAKDAELVQALLEGDGIVCQVTRVETREEFLASLEAGGFDLILADYSLPSFDGLSALQLAVEMRPEVPFIFVSGALGEEVAIEALKIGATDYVLKERLSRTSAAVRRALREATFRTERERAEQERGAHLWFLESMDRINRAMQGTQDLEHMLSEVLRAALEIFACDRAWLVYPCDPHAARWHAVMEQTRPEYPRAFAPGTELPIDADVAALFSAGLAAPGAILSGPGLSPAIPPQPAEQLAIRSQIAMVIEAKADRPYLFGLHQCSRTREWMAPERRLFQEIGRRFGDALASLSMLRSLRDSERKLGAAQKIAHVGWWERDYVSGHVSLSDEMCRIFGVQPLDLPYWQERWVSLIHPEDRERTVAASEMALAGGPRYDVEYRVVRPEGTVRVVHSQGDVIRDESGRPLRQFGVMQDITELRRAEDELRASEARFRTFVDRATDAFYLLDKQLRVVDVNRQACESLSLSRKELIGMNPSEFDAGLDEPSIRRLTQRADAGEIITFETHHRRKDGTAFPVEIRTGTFRQRDELFYLALARDISERKQAEERLRERDAALETARAELARMSRVTTLGELTTSIAHEVAQPLGGMITRAAACTRWLAAEPPDLAEARAALDNIAADGKRAREVIGRIRALTKRQTPRKEVLDVNKEALEVLALTERELRGHDIVLRTQLDRTLPRVAGDRVQLQQVLINLIMNAIEAMSGVRDRPRELTIVSGQDGPKAVRVEVRDSGTGLGPKGAERAFEAFYTTKVEGIGIGLSISRSIVEAHGGRLWASPNAPHGAVFRFSLPVTEEALS